MQKIVAANFRNRIVATNEKSHHEVPKTLPCFLVGERRDFYLRLGLVWKVDCPHHSGRVFFASRNSPGQKWQ